MIFAIVVIVHNGVTVWYVYYMVEMYFTMASRNMHSVEDTIISGIYEKAKYHNIQFNKRQYYYSRETKL
ncbi:MAG: hypothetical protein ACMG6E_09200 [Candidatus Roizmanbacteria bacterium]